MQDRSLQRTVERASRDFVEVDKTIFQERISEQMYERSEVYQCSRLVRLGAYFRRWGARREWRHVFPLRPVFGKKGKEANDLSF